MGPRHPAQAVRRHQHGAHRLSLTPLSSYSTDDPVAQAIRAFFALLSLLPHDPGVLRELAPLLASTDQYARATQLLLSAFEHYRALVRLVTPDTAALLNTYGYADLETLADFLLAQRQYAEAVRVVRQGVRWLQGRAREGGWDELKDDREYDEERRVRPGWETSAMGFEEAGLYELDVRLRSRLGLARLGMGMLDEAQVRPPPFPSALAPLPPDDVLTLLLHSATLRSSRPRTSPSSPSCSARSATPTLRAA